MSGASLFAVALVALPSTARAQDDRYWDPTNTGAGRGGDGVWDNTVRPPSESSWSPNADGTSGPYTFWDNDAAGGDNAIFGDVPTGAKFTGNITLGTPITVHNMLFEFDAAAPIVETAYTFSGNALTLTGAAPTITINGNNADTVTINSVIAGTAGLTKAGAGNLFLNGINTFSGGLALNAGALTVNGDAALGVAGNIVTIAAVNSDGTFTALNKFTSSGALSASRSVNLSGIGRVYVTGAGVDSAFFTGTGGLDLDRGVALTNNLNSYTGQTRLAASTTSGSVFSFTSIGDLGELSALGAPTDPTLGTIIAISSGNSSAVANYTGTGDSSNRNWDLRQNFFGRGEIRNSGTGTLTLTGNIAASTGDAVFTAPTADLELLGVISDNGSGDMTFSGSGLGRSITLGGANTYVGFNNISTVTVRASVLADTGSSSSLGTGTTLGASAAVVLNSAALSYIGDGDASNRTWTINGAGNIRNDGTGALTLSGGVAFQPGGVVENLTLGGSFAGVNTLSGVISETGNVIMDGGAGNVWLLTGANTYSGTTTVNNGILRVGNAAAFGVPKAVIVNGGELDLNGFDMTFASLAGTGGTVALNGAADLTVNGTTNTSFAGEINGAGGLIKLGTGTLTLTGANTYVGGTTVGGGTLNLDFTGTPVSNILSDGSTLTMTGGTLRVTGAAGETNTQNFGNLNVTLGNNRIVATSGAGGSTTVDFGAISRTGGLIDFGLPVSGAFTTDNPEGAIGGWATVTTTTGTDYAKVEGGNIVAFDADDYSEKDEAANWLDGEFITDNDGDAFTFSGIVNDPGDTIVELGGLQYTVSAASNVTIAPGETLSVDGNIIVSSTVGSATQAINGGSLTGGAGGGTLGILQNSTNTTSGFTIGSTIVDNGGATGFTKGGTGIVQLQGANSYTGVTTLSGGLLAVSTIGNGLEASNIGASTADASNLVLENGTLRYVGATDTTDRGFTLVNGGPTRTIQVTDAAANLTFTGLVTSPDDAGLTKTGAGTLTLANDANNYVGVTRVEGGTLSVDTLANGGAVSGIGASSSNAANLILTTATGQTTGTLQYTGGTVSTDRGFTLAGGNGAIDVSNAATTLTVGGPATGAGILNKNGDGTLVLSGTSNYTGGTVVNAGTLRAGTAAQSATTGTFGHPNARMTVNTGATVDLAGFNTTVGGLDGGGDVTLGAATLTLSGLNANFSGDISGSGGVIKTGGGTQAMTGCTNSYTGITEIVGGTLSTNCLANGGQASGIGASDAGAANLAIRNATFAYTGGSVTIDRGFTATGGGGSSSGFSVTDAAATLEFTGVFAGTGNIGKSGAGTLMLSGANTYSGLIRVVQGVVRAGSATAFGSAAVSLDNTAGATLDVNNQNASVTYLAGGGANGGNVTLGSGTLTISSGNGAIGASVNYAGAISGSGGLIKSGTAAQTLSGCDSSYTGGTIINGTGVNAALEVSCLGNGGSNSSIGASGAGASNLVLNGGTLRYIGDGDSTDRLFTLGAAAGSKLDASGSGAISFTNTGSIAFATPDTSQTITLGGVNTGDNSLAAQIANNGAGVTSLTKTDSGTWILRNSASSYTGVTTISGGVLGVDKLSDGGVASSIGTSSNAASSLVIGSGSTLRYTGAGDTTDRLFTLSTGSSFIESSGTGAINFSNIGSAAYIGSGNRTLALGGTNTGANTMGGTIIDGPGGVTTLAKNDAGTWVLTGNNTFTGNTVINDGNLMVGNGGASGNAGAGNVIINSATSTLSLNRSDTFNFTGTISGAGNLAQIGTGTTVLTAAGNIVGGATTISAGTLQVNGGLTTTGIAMTGTSALTVNGTVGAAGGLPSAITGDAGASMITVNAGGTLRANGDLGGGSDAVTLAGTLDTGGAVLGLGDGDDTLTLNDGGSILGAGVAAGTGTDTLQVNNAVARTLGAGIIGGFESLLKQNTGVLTLTGDHSYSAGTTIDAGTLQVGDGGTSGSIAGDIVNNGALTFNRSDALTYGGTVSGTGSLSQIGTGTTVLTGASSYTGGTTISAGTLQIGDGGTSGSIVGNVVNNAELVFNRSDAATFAGTISGTGGVSQIGTGTLILTGANSYAGGTLIDTGTLQISSDANLGDPASGLTINNGTLNTTADITSARAIAMTGVGTFLTGAGTSLALTGTVSGVAGLTKTGTGTLILSGPNSYSGATTVSAGTLLVDGDQSAATSATTVASGATLGGTGTIGGDVAIADGGTLAPGSGGVGALNINGALSLAGASLLDYQFGEANAPGSALNDVVNVGGDLTLDGTLNVSVSPGGSFDVGLYRVINYSGTLTDNGLALGTLPPGSDVFVQTSVSNQVNLINTAGATLNFWDGAAGPKNDDAVNGGDGTWQNSTGNDNWTEIAGTINAPWADTAFAIFQAAPGTVTVDNSLGAVTASGMQFASNGYVITGDEVTLVGPQSVVRVGDGTAAGAGYTATINAELTGATQLVKTDAGTLVLSGANSYTGGTLIDAGTLSISSDANLGDAAGGLSFDGGTLNTTADIASNRAIDLIGDGTFLTDAGTTLSLSSLVSGIGALTKDGAGTVVLAADNTYAGGTTIAAGTLQIGNGGTTGSILGDVTNNGTLALNRSDEMTFDGIVSGTGALGQIGTGTTILTGANSYTGGTTITAGILQLGNGGTTGSITGDVVNNGSLVFNRSDEVTFAGLISGLGSVGQIGSGTTILTGPNSYAGQTDVSAGTLLINGDQTAATGLTRVASGATLGGLGTIGGDVTLEDGATLAPGDASEPGMLTINGNLALAGTSRLDYQFGASNVVGGSLNDLTTVGGDLTLDGTIDVTVSAGGSFDVGVYRVISYGGTLTDNGLDLGSLPPGASAVVQTSVANQVNLVNAGALTLNFWDGAVGPKFDGAVNGGDGTWQNSTGNNNWTEVTGAINAAFTDAAFAIFSAAPGTVSVDNSLGAVSASGMQFASNGYVITGGDLTLVGPQSVIRVGDGTAAGAGFTSTIETNLIGTTQLVKTDLGTLVLTGANSYTGGTLVDAGTLRISSDANLGAAAGGLGFDGGTLNTTADLTSSRAVDLIGAATLLTDAATTLTLGGAISGAGTLTKEGTGILVLTGANGYAGATTVNAGTLFVNGNQSVATGSTSIASGATLGGTGTIGGDVTLANGATLAPGAGGVGTLTINGALGLGAGTTLDYQFGQANAAGGTLNDLVTVGGNLTLDGTINVSVPTGGSFGGGIYRVFNYGGALIDNGLALGTLPAGSDVSVQTAIAGQVNLVNTAGLNLNFWDGTVGPKNNNTIDGGDGIWRVDGGNNNWTELTGAVNADYAQDSFAIFAGAPGTVTIDDVGGAVGSSGMQFAVDGYTISGDALTLVGSQATVRVGDGTTAGSGYTATIATELTGTATLVKTDAGTLVLTGANSYTGGTAIDGGTVRVASDANLGAAAGALSFNGGTLGTTASFSSGRAVNLVGAGTLLTDTGTTLTLTGATAGVGGLTKSGTGTLVLAGIGGHTGGTSVGAGTLLVNGNYAGATGATTIATGATLGGTGTIGGDVALADGATLTPGAGGTGTLTINGDLSLSAGTQLAYEFGQANVAGGALNDLVNIGGDLVLDGTIDVAVPAGGAFDVGIYRVFNYGGALTNNGLTLGALPAGSEVTVQTSITGQVNLVNAAGLTLNFWDGAAGPKNNGVINGGNGTWQTSSGNDNWTEATGAVNAPYDDGAFAIFGGTGGTVTVDNSLGAVTAAGMQFAVNGYTITGNPVALTGPQSIIRVGDGSASGSGFTATINAVLTGATQLVKTDAGTLVLGGTNTYDGGTLITGGTVQIAADANLGAAAGDVTLDGGTLATSANMTSARDIVMAGAGTISAASSTTFTYDGLFSGPGALTKAGAGTLLVTGNNAGYTGGATVAAGTLAVQGTLGSAVAVSSGGRLEGTGQVGSVTNSGVVAPGRDGFGTLTVAGSYAGAGGILEIETELGGDSSQTDRLVIGGGTSGSTEVVVTNRGGLGAQTNEGIKIVDVTGGASIGTFALRGDYTFDGSAAVIAGAFGYRLYQGGTSTTTDGDWYLRSALLDGAGEPQGPLYQPGVPLYESYAGTLQTLNRLPTLQQRVGNRQWSGFTQGGIGMWGRMEASRLRPEAETSTSGSNLDVNNWSLQAGFDAALHDGTTGTLIAGINGRYGKANANVRSQFGDGDIDTSGYGVGATLTWYSNGGFYADAQAQVSWYRSDLESSVLGSLVDENHGSGEAFSLEVGKRAPLGGGLSVTPQIQMAYSNVRFDAFADPAGAAVSADTGSSLKSRWGISVDHQRNPEGASGAGQSHIYGIVNLSYEWLDGAVAGVSGTPLRRSDDRLWGELGLGGSYSWNGGRYALFSEVSADTAISNFGDSNELKANAGFRIRF